MSGRRWGWWRVEPRVCGGEDTGCPLRLSALFTEVPFLPGRSQATGSSFWGPAPLLWGVWVTWEARYTVSTARGPRGAGGLGSEFVTAFQRCHH